MISRTPLRNLLVAGGGTSARAQQPRIAIDGHDDRQRVGCVAFEPGTRNLLIGDSEGFVRRLGADGTISTLAHCSDFISCLVFSRDGALLASQAAGETPRIWRHRQHWRGGPLQTRLKDSVWLEFSHDGRLLYSGSEGGQLRVVPTAGGAARLLVGRGESRLTAFTASPRRDVLAVADWPRQIRLVSAAGTTLRKRADDAVALVFSPDATRLAAARADGTVTIYRATTLEPLQVFRAAEGPLLDLKFSPDGTLFAVGEPGGAVRVWNLATARARRVFDQHTGAAVMVAFSSDGKLLAAGGPDQCVTLWQVRAGRHLASIRFTGADGWLIVGAGGACDFSAALEDRLYVVEGDRPFEFAGYGAACRVPGLLARVLGAADEARPRARQSLQLVPIVQRGAEAPRAPVALTVRTKPTNKVRCLAFSHDGRTLAAGGRDMNIDLWSVDNRHELRTLRGHNGTVTSLSFSADGAWLASGARDGRVRLWRLADGSCVFEKVAGVLGTVVCAKLLSARGVLVAAASDGTVRYWDCATGRLLHTLRLSDYDYSTPCILSDDARLLAQLHDRGTVTVWDLARGQTVRRMRQWDDTPGAATFSPDGATLFVGCATTRQTIYLGVPAGFVPPKGQPSPIDACDLGTGALVSLEGHTANVMALAVAPDGKTLASGADDGTVRLWDLANRREILQANTPDHDPRAFAFSPDGRLLACAEARAPYRGRIDIFDTHTLAPTATFARHIGDVYAVLFSADGTALLTAGEDPRVTRWRLNESGGPAHLPASHTPGDERRVTALGWARDAHLIAAGSGDGTVRIWDESTSEQRAVLSTDGKLVNGVALSPDGRYAAAAGHATVWIWSVETGALLRTFDAGNSNVHSVAWSPAGNLVAAGNFDGVIHVWNALTGRRRHRWGTPRMPVYHLTFSPDGKQLASGHWDQAVRIWSMSRAAGVRVLEGHAVPGTIEKGTSSAFRADGRMLATTGGDATLRLWDTQSWKCLSTTVAHTGSCACVCFDPAGTRLAVCGNDAATTLWDVRDAHAPRQLAALYSFPDNSWAVLDPAGRYDAANGGDIPWLHWVVGLEPLALSQLKDRYYEPALLSKCLGLAAEPARPVPPLTDLPLYPAIEIALSAAGAKAHVTLTDRGGGIGRVAISINGKEVDADARGARAGTRDASLAIDVDVSGHRLLLQGARNRIDVHAYNADGFLVSRGAGWTYDAPATTRAQPQFWGVIVGTARYSNEKLNLRFPAHDARSVAAAIKLGAQRLFGADNVHLHVLATPAEAHEALSQRARVVEALKTVAQGAKSDDVLMIYLAGHGVSRGEGDYFYLTADAHTLSLDDPAVRARSTLSSAELAEWIKAIAALKQILVLDTCNAGGAVERLAGRSVPASQVRALERLKDRTGLHILAGAAADANAYESSAYGQGLLTYSLLAGMRGAALRDERFVDVERLFSFAADSVPALAYGLGGIQRPLHATPRAGASFDIGRIEPEDRASIPLAMLRPAVVRTAFAHEHELFDTLGLARRINEALRAQAARGPAAPLSFIDVAEGEFPDAYALAGRYSAENGVVALQARLRRGADTIGEFSISGSADSVVERLLSVVLHNLAQASPRPKG